MAKSQALFVFLALFLTSTTTKATSFQSDELLLQEDDEFEGVVQPDPTTAASEFRQQQQPAATPERWRRSDPDAPGESNSVQFVLEHALRGADSGFAATGFFTARLKSWSHGGQTLTKLRFSRNALMDEEKEAFKGLLKEDGIYTIRVPSNVLNPTGKGYVVSSVKARCLPRETLDEHLVIHMDGVNILAINYGSAGACQYPRPLKFPGNWSFSSYTVLKSAEQAPRTPSFAEQLIAAENGLGEIIKPPEKSFFAKYWMYLIPLGLVFMNTFTAAMKTPEEQAGQAQQHGAQRAPSAAVRRR